MSKTLFGYLFASAWLLMLTVRTLHAAPYEVTALTAEQSKEYQLPTSFYKKCTLVQGILIASSERVADVAHRETAYQFDMLMQHMKPDVAQRIRDRKVLCLLIGHDELTSDLPQFQTDKKGKDLDFYNWRQRGFLTHKLAARQSCSRKKTSWNTRVACS